MIVRLFSILDVLICGDGFILRGVGALGWCFHIINLGLLAITWGFFLREFWWLFMTYCVGDSYVHTFFLSGL